LTEAAAHVILPPPMRRLAAVALLALAVGCGDSPCQDLGERICSCNPGATTDACEAQTESQLEDADLSDDDCDRLLGTCNAVPPGAQFCEWLLTADGKEACGLTPPPPAPPAP
jgi:hypothetical protein